jgi:hypothetical protein
MLTLRCRLKRHGRHCRCGSTYRTRHPCNDVLAHHCVIMGGPRSFYFFTIDDGFEDALFGLEDTAFAEDLCVLGEVGVQLRMSQSGCLRRGRALALAGHCK